MPKHPHFLLKYNKSILEEYARLFANIKIHIQFIVRDNTRILFLKTDGSAINATLCRCYKLADIKKIGLFGDF